MVPILLVHAYAVGVVVAVVGCVGVVAYHLARRQGVTSLDLLALVFAALNLVLYFGFHNEWLIQHIAIVFYTLLAGQCAISLLRGDPWTTQFTRRVVRPEFVSDPRFRTMNTRSTWVWTAAFALCDVVSLLAHGSLGTWLPVGLMGVAVIVSRVSGRRYLDAALQRDDDAVRRPGSRSVADAGQRAV